MKVLLLEAGKPDKYWWIHVPVGLPYLLGNKEVDWCYQSEPEPYCDNRVTPVPRGKTLGGSSAINAMCYIRGHARDYDIWRQLGNVGWSWEDVLPHFKSIEKYPRGANDVHGCDGELCIQDTRVRWEVVEAWKQAAIDFGIPETADHNGGETEGVGYFQGTIDNGRRCSSARAFLHPVMHRENLQVITEAHAKQIRLEGKRAVGVEFWQGDTLRFAASNGEVILSAGAIGSPQLLELSGIGQGALLRQHGIAVRHELPGVGENMQDHWLLRQTYRVKNTITLNQWVSNPIRRNLMGAYYLLTKHGPMGTQPPQLCAFTRSDPSQETPNLQYHVGASTSDRFGGPTHSHPGFNSSIVVVRPQSIGYCHIKSPDPRAHPAILHFATENHEPASRIPLASPFPACVRNRLWSRAVTMRWRADKARRSRVARLRPRGPRRSVTASGCQAGDAAMSGCAYRASTRSGTSSRDAARQDRSARWSIPLHSI